MGVSATTQIIPPEKITTALLEEIEPDTMRVDPSAFEARKTELQQEIVSTAPEGDYDDTVLAQPPEIPQAASEAAAVQSPDEFEYTQAIDYAQSIEAAGAEPQAPLEPEPSAETPAAASMSEPEAQPLESEPVASESSTEPESLEAISLDDIEPEPHEEIQIETMGEDFVGDDFEVLEDISLESGGMGDLQSFAGDETEGSIEPAVGAELDDGGLEPLDMEESIAVDGETPLQEITLSAPEFEELSSPEESAQVGGEIEASAIEELFADQIPDELRLKHPQSSRPRRLRSKRPQSSRPKRLRSKRP